MRYADPEAQAEIDRLNAQIARAVMYARIWAGANEKARAQCGVDVLAMFDLDE